MKALLLVAHGSRRAWLLSLLALLSACGGKGSDGVALQTVASLDFERYMGRWYEVAKIPNRFQSHCAHGAMADYQLLESGRLAVTNSCITAEGERDSAEGVSRIVEPQSRAKLQVSFVSLFGWPLFWGDYWVLALGPDYEYAVIGTPGRQYGWVLARDTQLSEAQWQAIHRTLQLQGYNPQQFEQSRQP